MVTDGEYDDYHICATFLDKSIAKKWVSVYGGNIEEWETTSEVPKPYLFQCSIFDDGTQKVVKLPPCVNQHSDCKYGSELWSTYKPNGGMGHAVIKNGKTEKEAIQNAKAAMEKYLSFHAK